MAVSDKKYKALMVVVVILVILNVVLFGYILVNSGMFAKEVGLSPFPWADQCNDGKPDTVCWLGDILGNTQLQIQGSKIKQHSADSQLQILSDKAGGIKLSGIDYSKSPPGEKPTNVQINGDLAVKKVHIGSLNAPPGIDISSDDNGNYAISGASCISSRVLNLYNTNGELTFSIDGTGIIKSNFLKTLSVGSYNYLCVDADGKLVAKSSPCK